MGTFSTEITVTNILDRSRDAVVRGVPVESGSGHTWISKQTLESIGIAREKKDLAFVMANGIQITRGVGFAIVKVESSFTGDEVVFAEDGDLLLLGARSLEGLNLTVDSRLKKLVASGPITVA